MPKLIPSSICPRSLTSEGKSALVTAVEDDVQEADGRLPDISS
jgi:hypothetical protein